MRNVNTPKKLQRQGKKRKMINNYKLNYKRTSPSDQSNLFEISYLREEKTFLINFNCIQGIARILFGRRILSWIGLCQDLEDLKRNRKISRNLQILIEYDFSLFCHRRHQGEQRERSRPPKWKKIVEKWCYFRRLYF